MQGLNFTADVVDAAPRGRVALVELTRGGGRRTWRFGELSAAAGSLAAVLQSRGVRRGDVVMTVLGNRAEWVFTILAALRLGAAVLPCTEQLRAPDLSWRLGLARPRIVVADHRNREELSKAGPACEVLFVPDDELVKPRASPPAIRLQDTDPAFVVFTSGTTGKPRAVVHGQRYLWGQALQAKRWLAPEAGELVWCTASAGWSKSARNAFIAPWLRGAAGLVHDARFDPDERVEIARREQVNVLCMAPTEYRMIARGAALTPVRSLRRAVAAGEPLDTGTAEAWREATGLAIADGYGQTETGHLTYPGPSPRLGSMGVPLPGVRMEVDDGELVVDSSTVPTFFLGYLGGARASGWWRTGDRVTEDAEGRLWFEARMDDVILSSGYRIGPEEVESVLLGHPAIADAAVVGAPDQARGEVVRAFVVLRDGCAPGTALIQEIQRHVRGRTAPYKYPRDVRFVDELPRTASGKVRRSVLRAMT